MPHFWLKESLTAGIKKCLVELAFQNLFNNYIILLIIFQTRVRVFAEYLKYVHMYLDIQTRLISCFLYRFIKKHQFDPNGATQLVNYPI